MSASAKCTLLHSGFQPGQADMGRRFVPKSRDQVTAQLSSEIEGLKSEIANLSKKLHYLETTHKNSREHISRILSSRG